MTKLKYNGTNTYLIRGLDKYILFDTGRVGSFDMFCRALDAHQVRPQEIAYLLISHFHLDHMGIAQEIANLGIPIVVFDVQKECMCAMNALAAEEDDAPILTKQPGAINERRRLPIDEQKVLYVAIKDSRRLLSGIGISGEVLYTPGHTDDSISLWLDDRSLFVGDLNPLYELSMHQNTQIGDMWEKLLQRNPRVIYYGHAAETIVQDYVGETGVLDYSSEIFITNAVNRGIVPAGDAEREAKTAKGKQTYKLVASIMRYTDKKYSVDKIQKKTGADREFVQDVMRMYLTHQNVSVQGILDRIEIKNR